MKRFIEIIKYTCKAKGRHGIHSPFVYDLVDQCFRIPVKNINSEVDFRDSQLSNKSIKLLTQLAKHFQINELASNVSVRIELERYFEAVGLSCVVQNLNELNQEERKDLTLVYYALEKDYSSDFAQLRGILSTWNDQTLLLLDGIRNSQENLTFWSELSADHSIHFTADLYSMGLLSKRPQQVKEHFVLRY